MCPLQQATTSTSDNDWELDPHEIVFNEKIASGAFGDLFRGSYCGQDVAIKILRNVHEDSQQFQEFLQVGGGSGWGVKVVADRPAAAGGWQVTGRLERVEVGMRELFNLWADWEG